MIKTAPPTTPLLAWLFPLALGACATAPPLTPTGPTGINLTSIALVEAEPAVRTGCSASIVRALRRHGITADPLGPRVSVEVAFWQDTGRGDAADLPATLDSTWAAGATTTTATRRTSYTADLTASMRVGLGFATRKILASATAGDNEAIQDFGPTGGPARIRACAIGAERLATALVETMNTNASR
ncbi:MAG: hypothetical protein ABJE95_16280 [Byssovorax sp.]